MKNFLQIGFVLVWASLSGPAAFSSALINGAGATFPNPLYSKWFSEYQKVRKDVQINYQSVGSGMGIKQFTEKTVDFGASDSPMTDDQLKSIDGQVLHIPTVLGAVVLTYNLPSLAGKTLHLTPALIANIYLGKITKWNDPAIVEENRNLSLPASDIIVAARADGSGTTGIFTDYLAKVSDDWRNGPGAGTSVKWPVGLRAKGNEGVMGLVKTKQGAIGYVELIYAEANKLPYASLKNKAGRYIKPTTSTVSAAAAGTNMPKDFRVSITNADGMMSYPISGFTYLLLRQKMPREQGEKLIGFLKWAMKDGQKLAPQLSYAPLPNALVKKVESKIASIQLQ